MGYWDNVDTELFGKYLADEISQEEYDALSGTKYEYDLDKFMIYNGIEIPRKEVENLMDKLNITDFEACRLWLADHDKITNPEQEELDKKAKMGARHYEKSANPRKNVKKERKIDFDKGYLLSIISKILQDEAKIDDIWQKTETELYFSFKNAKYTVKLTKHRPKK